MGRQRFGTFTGGIDLPDEKDATLNSAIMPVAQPTVLRVPVDPCRLGDVDLRVEPAQTVESGDILAVAGGEMPIFAPMAGRVVGLTPCVLADRFACGADRGQGRPAEALEITVTGSPADMADPSPVFDWRAAEPEQVLQRITEGGLTTCDQPLQSLGRWCRAMIAAGVDTLIGNGMENQPYLTAEHRLLASRGARVVEGLAILQKALCTERALLAVDARRIDRYRRIDESADAFDVESLAVEHKYPMGHPKILSMVLTARTPAPEQSPADIGVAVVNVSTCFAVYQWVACQRHVAERVVTVSGIGVGSAGNLLVPVGTPVEHVLAACDAPSGGDFCHGGPMTGSAMPAGAVVTQATCGLLSLDAGSPRPATACIRCGWCTDHCPVRLDVANLNDMYELNQIGRARRYEVAACIGCGVCSYVCPARLPLAYRVRTLKRLAGQGEATGAR